jgi:lambda repressor-like predicted transcriptional regulator
LARDAKGHEDWSAVDQAIKAQLDATGMALAQLARDTGLSENTIRYMGESDGGTESPLVAIAAVFGWPLDYLRNILHGEPEKNDQDPAETLESSESLAEPRFRNLLRAELGPVKKDVAALRGIVDRMDQKIDRIVRDRDNEGSDDPA